MFQIERPPFSTVTELILEDENNKTTSLFQCDINFDCDLPHISVRSKPYHHIDDTAHINIR